MINKEIVIIKSPNFKTTMDFANTSKSFYCIYIYIYIYIPIK